LRRRIDEGYTEAKRILTEKFEDLDRLGKGLLNTRR
jgi:cell division protease FtsH